MDTHTSCATTQPRVCKYFNKLQCLYSLIFLDKFFTKLNKQKVQHTWFTDMALTSCRLASLAFWLRHTKVFHRQMNLRSSERNIFKPLLLSQITSCMLSSQRYKYSERLVYQVFFKAFSRFSIPGQEPIQTKFFGFTLVS